MLLIVQHLYSNNFILILTVFSDVVYDWYSREGTVWLLWPYDAPREYEQTYCKSSHRTEPSQVHSLWEQLQRRNQFEGTP